MDKMNTQLAKTLNIPVLLYSFPVAFIMFMLPIYSKELGASALEISGLFSIFAAATLIIRPFTGWALDRFGRKPFLLIALFFFSCSMVVFIFADSIFRLYIASFIEGIGSLFIGVSITTIVADMSLSSERGKEMGGIFQQQARGSILGVFFGFFLLNSFPPLVGWKVVFLGYTIMTIVAFWLAWRNVPETKPVVIEHRRQPHDKNKISKQLFQLMFIVFVTGTSKSMSMPIIMIFLQDKFTANIGQLALAFLPGALAIAFFAARFGELSDRFGRIRLMIIGLLSAGIFSIIIPYSLSLINLGIIWILFNITESMSVPAQTAMVSDIVGEEKRGMSYGLYDFSMNLGYILGPLLGGWLYDSIGKAMPFYLNGIILLISGGLVLIFMREQRFQSNEVS